MLNCYRAHVFRPLSLQVPPFTLTILRPYPYSYTLDKPAHSFSFFHTSQEQDETAHSLHLTIWYWYMCIGIHWGRGHLETGDYMLGTFRAHVHLSHNVTGG